MEPEMPVVHSFPPIFDADARVLILGTMASPASLAAGINYGHPQNAFWRIMSALTGEACPAESDLRRAMLRRHHIALWDTLAQCRRPGAADSDIREEQPNDVAALVKNCPQLRAVFLNGAAAFRFYRKYHAADIPLPYFLLPSTSPANAKGGFETKIERWRVIADYLK